LEGDIGTRQQALEKAREYYTKFQEIVKIRTHDQSIPETEVWKELSREIDPRVI
jgi:hypothetical protein